MSWKNLFVTVAVAFIFAVSGCSPQTNSSNRPSANSNSDTAVIASAPKDGDIISLKKINDSSYGTTLYEMFYESDGKKVAAYLETPQKAGKYPLEIICHGGWAIPRPDVSHDNGGYPINLIQYHEPTALYLYPEYAGYLDSDGHPEGLHGAVDDIQNAITATVSATSAKPAGIFINGASLGGGAALMVASERNDVKAVMVDSPFVGIDLFYKWYGKLGKPKALQEGYTQFVTAYGTENPNAQVIQDQSVSSHISDISSPCLIFQGTADQNVVWQTVSDFASQMKQAGKTVKYVQIPGGTHAAVTFGKYPQYLKLWHDWFTKYGFPSGT